MSFSIPVGSVSERADEYRLRAQEIAAYAATLTDQRLRDEFRNIAASYQHMADHLSETNSLARAVEVSTQPQAANDMAAMTVPPDETER